MEDAICTTEGIRIGDLGVVADEVEPVSRCEEIGIARDGDTNGGDRVFASAVSMPATSYSGFRSTRIENMVTSRSEFETDLEFRTAFSKVHWSELSHERASSSEDQPGVDHRHYFEKLQKDVHWGPFCSNVEDVVLGRKLGEGAQANIYEVEALVIHEDGSFQPCQSGSNYVVKVMKCDCALEDLQCQWPHGIVNGSSLWNLCGALVKEPITERNKFGFVMHKFCGDLRSLIDRRMEHKNAKGPPFSLRQAKYLMYAIVDDMVDLHNISIIHKDLKASNVLISHCKVCHDDGDVTFARVADWECSVGVVGTGFWRAPEIFQ